MRQRASGVGVTLQRRFARWSRSVERLLAGTVGGALALMQLDVAVAHTGDDATFKHVVIEFALWGAGLAVVLALLVAIFWVRAKFLRQGS